VIPKRENGQYFQGNIYIVEGDWRLYSADLMLTNKRSSLNLVDTFKVSQQYIPITDSIWMPAAVQLNFRGSVLGFKFGGYYQGIYNNYKLNPTFPKGFFNGEILRIDTAANIKTANYWNANRPVPLTRPETRDYQKKDSIAAYKKPMLTWILYSIPKTTSTTLPIPYLAIKPVTAPKQIRFIYSPSCKRFIITRLKVSA
jgi:hypothetical protein